MSFSLTTDAYRDGSKTITRRDGWWKLKPGDVFMGCVKCMGLRKGEKVQKIHAGRVVSTRPEMLGWLLEMDGPHYTYDEACEEVAREGFAGRDPEWFVEFYLRDFSLGYVALREKAGATEVNRIEFEHVEEQPSAGSGIMDSTSFHKEPPRARTPGA